jgi:hypothetical protein
MTKIMRIKANNGFLSQRYRRIFSTHKLSLILPESYFYCLTSGLDIANKKPPIIQSGACR